MYERIPTKRSVGGRVAPLTAKHANILSEIARKQSAGKIGTFNHATEGVVSSLPPHVEWVVEVTEVVDASIGHYRVKPRFYDFLANPDPAWDLNDEENDCDLDISCLWPDAGDRPRLTVGARLTAWWHAQRVMFVPAHLPGNALIRFELYEDLELGLEALAKYVIWNGVDYVTIDDETFTVKDFTKDPGSWYGKTGYRGWATLPSDNDDGKYEIVWMETVARWVEFELYDDMTHNESKGLYEAHAIVLNWWHIKDPGYQIIVSDPQELFRRALQGARGIAIYDEKRKLYVVVECQTQAGWIRFTTLEDITTPGTTARMNVTVDDYGGTQQDTQFPGGEAIVYDKAGLFKRAKKGAQGMAIYDEVLDIYLAVECQTKAGEIEFTLTADKPGISATATINRFYGTQQDVQDPLDSTVTVYDEQGLWPYALSGAKGVAVYDAEEDKYRIVACQQLAIMIQATLDGNMLSSDGNPAVTFLRIYNQPPFNQTPVGTINAINDLEFEGVAGSIVVLSRDENAWRIIQVQCPP